MPTGTTSTTIFRTTHELFKHLKEDLYRFGLIPENSVAHAIDFAGRLLLATLYEMARNGGIKKLLVENIKESDAFRGIDEGGNGSHPSEVKKDDNAKE